MSDDLKFNNIPSAELEKLSKEIDEKNTLMKTANPEPENTEDKKSEALETQPSAPTPEEPSLPDEANSESEQVFPPNTGSNKPPRTNTLRNKNNYGNTYPQNGYQYVQNTYENNQYPRTNTLRNRNGYSRNNYGNAYSQNGYQYPPNTSPNNQYSRTNTLRNRQNNSSPQNNYGNAYPQNGYQYPPNTSPNNQYPRTNTLRNKPANGYPQNNYGYPPNTSSNNQYPRTNTLRNRTANGYPNAYHPYGQPYPQQPNNGYPQGYAPAMPSYYYDPSPKELEKLSLAKDCSKVGGTTIAIFIVMYVVAFIIELIGVFCGVVRDVPDLANDPYAGFTPMGFYLFEGLTSLVSVFIPTLIMMKSTGRSISHLIPFKKIEGKKLFAIVMCGMSLCMVAQLMATLIGVNLGLFGIDVYEGLETATATGIFDLIMNTVCTAIIPALVEEFAYRGLVAGLLKEHDDMLAVFCSAFLFGMLHGNFAQIPFAFVVGLILGYIRVKTDSMLPSILIHFGNNFYAVVITILQEALPEPYGTIVDAAVILVLIVIGFIATNYLTRNHKDLFKVDKKYTYLSYSEKLKVFFKSGTVIVSMILLTITSFIVLLVV